MSNELKYTQEDVDNLIAKTKAKSKERYDSLVANDYVSKDQFASLQAENKELRRQVILPKLQQELMSAGCKKECVNDLLQLNGSLFDCKEEDIKYNIQKCREARPYMFDNGYSAETGNNVVDPDKQMKPNDAIETSLGTIITRNN